MKRGRDSSPDEPASVSSNILLANIIKDHHELLRRAAASTATGDDGRQVWQAVISDTPALEKYAAAMKELGDSYWGSRAASGETHLAVDDRLSLIVDAVRQYTVGNTEVGNDRSKNGLSTFGLMVRKVLKPLRREHFDKRGEPASTERNDILAMLESYCNQASPHSLCRRALESLRGGDFISLPILDVGSCYGPLGDLARWECVKPWEVVSDAIDLHPHPSPLHVVHRCDFSDVTFHDGEPRLRMGDPRGRQTVVASVQRCGYAVVVLCLVLSYLPTAALRDAVVQNVHEALMPDGLLVVISTRTEGPRSTSWIAASAQRVESKGFALVLQSTHRHLVRQAYRKL